MTRERRQEARSRLESTMSSSSQLTTGSNKRKAPVSTTGPPQKKARRPHPLATKLEALQKTVARLDPFRVQFWRRADPGDFMDTMRPWCEKVKLLTLSTVEEFITQDFDDYCDGLDVLQTDLLGGTSSVGSQPVQRTDSYEKIRHSMIRYLQDVRVCLEAIKAQALAKPAPCDFADHKIWRVYQAKDDAILCLRPADKRGLPIALMHKAFCVFANRFHQPSLDEHLTPYLPMADKLCWTMPSAFDSEDARRDYFESIFILLDQNLTQNLEYHLPANSTVLSVRTCGARPDVAKTISYEGGNLVLMLEEFKNEHGDIYMQICRVYEVLCEDPKVECLLEFGNPVFLLCILGPYLMVCGAVKRTNVHVEPLTPFLPMFPGYGIEGHIVQLAKCLGALKQGLDALQTFWQNVGVTRSAYEKLMIKKHPIQHLNCPDNGLLSFDNWEGTFESPMHDKKDQAKLPCFLAKLCRTGADGAHDEVQVVVKFVYNYSGTYGKATHEYLHSLKLAPRLYSAVDLHRGLVMVVMEHLAFQGGIGGWVELDMFKKMLDKTMADAVKEQLKKTIDVLKKQKMVHADLRPKNIMVEVDGQGHMKMHENKPTLSFIDFDWAGMVGKARYPPFLNPQIPWPEGAKAFVEVGEDDDRILVENWWEAFIQPTKSS